MDEQISDEDFKKRAKKALESLTQDEIETIASQFQVATSTVYRWASGVAKPFRGLRRQILKAMENKPT